jgi:hypothetical protein
MKSILWFRITAVLLFLHCVGYSFSFLILRPYSSEGRAVWTFMRRTRIPDGDSTVTYSDFYTGFGLFTAAFFLLEAFLAWYCSFLVGEYVEGAIILGWSLLLLQALSLLLSWRYFSTMQVVISAFTGACAGIALAFVTPPPAL